MDILKKCNLCYRNCLIDRYKNFGYCKQSNKIKVAKACIINYEEPCISGKNGSGAIFFSGCNLRCVFCQNKEISIKNYGTFITSDRLANIMIELQEKKATNINLVTPTMHIIGIRDAIIKAKKRGLKIPIIYNTGTYENPKSLELLKGLIDVYLPDLKYYNDKYANKYSNAPNYFKNAKEVIKEMYKQVGSCKFDKNGNIIKGVIVRHLMLPSLINDSKKILKYLYNTYQDNIYISIMNQYTIIEPLKFKELNTIVKKKDYDNLVMYAIKLGITNAYCQLDNTSSKKYIPKFDLEGVK